MRPASYHACGDETDEHPGSEAEDGDCRDEIPRFPSRPEMWYQSTAIAAIKPPTKRASRPVSSALKMEAGQDIGTRGGGWEMPPYFTSAA